MRGKLVIKYAEGIIEMSREFAKYAEQVGSDEYNLLQQTRRDYPNFRVVRKQIAKKKDKESYKGLTYEYMENYIKLHDDKEETIMKEYKEMRLLAACHSIRYPVIKKWFFKQFPEVEKFGVLEVKEEAPAQENAEAEAPAKLAEIMSIHAQEEKEMDIGA